MDASWWSPQCPRVSAVRMPWMLFSVWFAGAALGPQVARRLKLEPIDSPFFKLSVPLNKRGLPVTDSRVAPGMEVFFTVTFTSRERLRDYNYDLVCVTEREKFIVPLRARGVRPMLALPETAPFGTVAVKTLSTKTVVVRIACGVGPHPVPTLSCACPLFCR
jgi:hypothetical protein